MKKAIHNFSKLLAWAFFGVALFSCSNASGGYDSSSSNRKSYPVVRFMANMQSDFAAAPQEISGLVSRSAGTTSFYNDGASRSAMPDIAITSGDGGFKYYVEAVTGTPGSDSYIRHFVYGTTSTMELGLESGKTWNVTCGIGEIGPEDSEDPNSKKIVLTNYMSDNDPSVTITPDEPVYVKTFGLKPSITTDGTGTIELRLKIKATTWYVKVSCSAQGWIDAVGSEPLVLNEHKDNDSPILHIGSIKSGIYDVVFKFHDDKGALNYCTVQSINVFDDMTTSVWRDDGSGAVVTEGGQTVFKVTDAVIDLFTQNTMYVGATGLGLAPDNQNSGTAYEPLATLQEAAYRIRKYGNGKDYTIFVGGTIQGCTTFDSDITRDQAKTITIMGYNDSGDKLKGYASKLGDIVDFNGVPISAYFPESKEFNPVITVKTAVPITIQNVDICEGASNGGSGLCIDGAGCSVTIKDGVTISGNKTGRNGGGVSVRAGKFYMKGGKITGNSAFNSSSGNLVGGGVCLRSGAYFEMTGGEISLNRACYGGGVGLVNLAGDSGSNKFIFKRGKISQNIADGFVSGGSKCGYGGGIMITSGSETVHHQVTMTGGEISGNKVNVDSSAVEVSSSAIFEMTGGVIKDNSLIEGESDANYHDISVSYGANYFCLGGSAYIPAGTGKNHCVYLNSYKNGSDPLQMAKIDLSSNLSRHSQSDPLVIQFNTSGEHAAKRGATVASASFDLTDAKEYIVPASSDWNLKLSSDKKSLVLDAPIWVAGSGKKQAGTPTSTGPGTKAAPYDSIYHACAQMNDLSVEYTVLVDGQLYTADGIHDAVRAASITIQGANGNNSLDVLNGQGSVASHMLSLLAPVDVTIKDLKITGAKITAMSGDEDRGGGVYSATDKSVTLSSGTLITGNKAAYGGAGVYKKNGKLVIEDGAEISGNTTELGASGGGVYIVSAQFVMTGGKICGNHADCTTTQAGYGGGVYLASDKSATTSMVMSGGQISANSSFGGGGIYCNPGEDANGIKIFLYGSATIGGGEAVPNDEEAALAAGGNIAVGNPSDMTSFGGGICACKYTKIYLGYKPDGSGNPVAAIGDDKLTGGIIGNYTERNAGGVFVLPDAELHLSSGTIAYNKALNAGGAVLNRGAFSIGDDACIPAAEGAGCNDVYLDQGKKMDLASPLAKHSKTKPINVRVNEGNYYPRGKTLVSSAFEMSDEQAAAFKFYFVNEDNEAYISTDKKSIYINMAIYVAGTGTAASPYYICGTAGHDTNGDGSKQKPYATISKAITKMTDATVPYIINVDGTITGKQEILSLLNPTSQGAYRAASVLIQGASTVKKDDGSPRDSLNGNFSSKAEGNITLKISSRVPVTLKHITITGGKSDGKYEAGGLHVDSNCNVTLDENAYVINNKTKACGAGIYSQGTLTIKSGAKISGNTIDTGTTSSDDGGCAIYSVGSGNTLIIEGGEISSNTCTKGRGVIYLTGKCFIYGDAEICNNNVASNFGGIHLASVANPALLYLGYKSCNDDNTPNEIKEWTGKIDGNTSQLRGSAISGLGTVYMNSGTISNNNQEGPDSSGFAAIYLYGTSQSKFVMTGGVIKNNKSAGNPGNAFLLNGTPLVLSGSAYIPCASDHKHCVSLGEYSGVKATINIAEKLEPPEECTDGIVAAVQPKNYEVNTPILTISVSPNPSTTIAAEVDKFALVPAESGHYYISGNDGKLKFGYPLTLSNIDDTIAMINSGSAGQTLVLENCSVSDFSKMKDKLKKSNLTKSVVLDMTDSGITELSQYMFTRVNDYDDSINASKVILPSGITKIAKDAFWNSRATEEVVMPDSVTELGEDCFANSTIKTIVLSPNLVTIGDAAFYQCSKLEEITIPASVTTIEPYSGGSGDGRNGASPFIGCYKLKSITVEELNSKYQSIDGVLIDKVNHNIMFYPPAKDGTEYTTPSGVTGALPYTFYQSSNLKKLILSNDITAIPAYFMGSSSGSGLEEVTIGTGCTGIGIYAFSGADKLKTAVFSNKNGWKAGDIDLDLQNTSNAATYLKRSKFSGGYNDDVWTRNP